MFAQIIVSMVTSSVAKNLIAMLVQKLLNHQSDGVTKDVAEAMLDGIAISRANKAPTDAIEAIKQSL